jgi:VIT1/CCC1 family predicted Fe2+/Mn2+ transporter
MKMSTVWSIIGAIIAVIIGWWVVNIAFSVAWFLVKAIITIVVALAIFGIIKASLKSKDGDRTR